MVKKSMGRHLFVSNWPFAASSYLKNGQPRPLFCLFSFLTNTNFTEKTVGVSRIRTQIVEVEGKHADHLTTTTAQPRLFNTVLIQLVVSKV